MDNSQREKTNAEVQKFVQLLSSNQHRVYAYILSMLHNGPDADDVMQETSVVMWNKFKDFRAGTDFVAWGIAIAHYRILKFRNHQQNKRTQLSNEAIEAISSDAVKVLRDTDYRMNALRDCLGKLPDSDLYLVKLRYDEGLSVNTIAEKLGKNIRAIYRAISRSHELLLCCIKKKLNSEIAG